MAFLLPKITNLLMDRHFSCWYFWEAFVRFFSPQRRGRFFWEVKRPLPGRQILFIRHPTNPGSDNFSTRKDAFIKFRHYFSGECYSLHNTSIFFCMRSLPAAVLTTPSPVQNGLWLFVYRCRYRVHPVMHNRNDYW